MRNSLQRPQLPVSFGPTAGEAGRSIRLRPGRSGALFRLRYGTVFRFVNGHQEEGAGLSVSPFGSPTLCSHPGVGGDRARPEQLLKQGYAVSSVTNSSRVSDRQLNVSVLAGGSPTGR